MGLPVAGSELASVVPLQLYPRSRVRTADLEGLARLCGYPFTVDICLRLLKQRLVIELGRISIIAMLLPSASLWDGEARARWQAASRLTGGTEWPMA